MDRFILFIPDTNLPDPDTKDASKAAVNRMKFTSLSRVYAKIKAFHSNTLEYSFSDDAEVLSKRSCTVHVSEKFTYILLSYFHYIFKRLWISTNMHLSFEYII